MIDMMFREQYEGVVRMMDDSLITVGPFDTYEDCKDAIILLAVEELPEKETVKGFLINKSFINKAVAGG